MTLIIAGAVTFIFTTLLTIAGVGAAFILIPVFMALGIELQAAMATALLLNSISMSVASVNFARHKLIVWRIAFPIIVAASAFSPLGAITSQGLNRNLLLWMFVGFLLFAAMMMIFYSPKPKESSYKSRALLWVGMSVGCVAGFVGGLLGVGGGNIIVPVLVALGFGSKKASATTSFVVIFASFSGFLGHMAIRGVNHSLLCFTALGSVAGAALGSYLMSDKLKSRQVKIIIGFVLIGIALKIAWGLL